MAGEAWSDEENDAIVADYFAMLRQDLRGQTFNKAEHNRSLQDLTGRGRSSIEYKHRNISAVMKSIGETWIAGYIPAFKFQASLQDAILRWLNNNPNWSSDQEAERAPSGFQDGAILHYEAPPTQRNSPPPEELDLTIAMARKIDRPALDERNRALGRAGEECVLRSEKALLQQSGCPDLAEAVVWTADEHGDGAGYDIESFAPDGSKRLIEVKTTNGWDRTPFHISRNEVRVAQERNKEWHLVRLYNFSRGPRAFELRPPLEAHVSLMPTNFEARLH